MMKAYRYRLYPSRLQELALLRHLDLTRELYNAALQERRDAYRKSEVSITKAMQEKALLAVKEARPEFAVEVHAHVLQDVITRLDRAFDGFFRRVKAGKKAGYPRFKGKGWWDSFRFKECSTRTEDGWKWTTCGRPDTDGKRINLPKIGKVKIRMHRSLEGRPKTLTIKREGSEWYAVYTCEVEEQALPAPDSSLGLDMGTRFLFTTSEGKHEPNPEWLSKSQRKVTLHSQSLARKKQGSKRRHEAKRCLAKAHLKVRRQRLDHAHKAARKLVQAHGTLVVEDLQPSRMVHSSSNLSRSIHDAGWTQFLSILDLKAASAGGRVIRVDPAYTSQRCYACGYIQRENRRDETFRCLQCGHEDHADVNAAKNIREKGIDPAGYAARSSTAARIRPAGEVDSRPPSPQNLGGSTLRHPQGCPALQSGE